MIPQIPQITPRNSIGKVQQHLLLNLLVEFDNVLELKIQILSQENTYQPQSQLMQLPSIIPTELLTPDIQCDSAQPTLLEALNILFLAIRPHNLLVRSYKPEGYI